MDVYCICEQDEIFPVITFGAQTIDTNMVFGKRQGCNATLVGVELSILELKVHPSISSI